MNATPDNTLADPEQIIADLQRQLAEREAELVEAREQQTTPPTDDVIAELRQQLEELRAERDAALAGKVVLTEELAARTTALAQRNTEYRERIEHQAATIDVLKVMSASPGDPQPVFDLIVRQARDQCNGANASFYEYDGMIHFRSIASRALSSDEIAAYARQFPMSLEQEPNNVVAVSIRDRRIVHFRDPAEGELTALARSLGVKSGIVIPLIRGDATFGCIAMSERRTGGFTDSQVELLKTFAEQAVIAITSAQTYRDLHEALEQQTATAEVLQVINSSPGSLAPVFDAILEKAHRLCGATHGSLQLFDGEKFRAVATYGISEVWAERTRDGLPAVNNPLTEPLLEGARLVHIADMVDVNHPLARVAAEATGVRTALLVPLRKDNRLIGAISALRREVRPFTEKEFALLENFAAQAVIAMENARLLTETQEALEQQTATAEVLQVINSSPGDLQPVFEAILEKAHNLCGVASGALQLYDGGNFRAVATNGLPEPLAKWLRDGWPPGSSQQRVVAGEADIIHIADLAASDSPRARYVADIGGVRTLLYVALRKDQRLLGVISASRFEVRPFSEKEIALLQNFAAQAVIAMENARLLGELRQRTDEVAELNRGLEARVAEQVEELGRVGRLKRFLAPQLAELIVSQGNEKILESHRREIVVVFCDLRGYTAFTETAEPEEVLDFLRDYHGALGPLVAQFEGTLDQFSGDGIMVFFNDPVPIPNPAARAVNMAVAMREAAGTLIADWRERGRDLGFGVGIAQGYATLGQIGFSERSGYTAIGTVCNVAARLCAEARDGQILLSQRINAALRGSVVTEQVGSLALKGLTQPVVAYNVPLAGSQAAFRVIEGGPPSV